MCVFVCVCVSVYVRFYFTFNEKRNRKQHTENKIIQPIIKNRSLHYIKTGHTLGINFCWASLYTYLRCEANPFSGQQRACALCVAPACVGVINKIKSNRSTHKRTCTHTCTHTHTHTHTSLYTYLRCESNYLFLFFILFHFLFLLHTARSFFF